MSADSEKSTATPSTDPINPEANRWLRRDAQGRLFEIDSRGSIREISPTALHAESAYTRDLARRLGADPQEVAGKLDPDIVRRTKYPMAVTDNKDGTRSYQHTIGVKEGLVASHTVDRSSEPFTAPKARTAEGKFTK